MIRPAAASSGSPVASRRCRAAAILSPPPDSRRGDLSDGLGRRRGPVQLARQGGRTPRLGDPRPEPAADEVAVVINANATFNHAGIRRPRLSSQPAATPRPAAGLRAGSRTRRLRPLPDHRRTPSGSRFQLIGFPRRPRFASAGSRPGSPFTVPRQSERDCRHRPLRRYPIRWLDQSRQCGPAPGPPPHPPPDGGYCNCPTVRAARPAVRRRDCAGCRARKWEKGSSPRTSARKQSKG